MGWGGIIAGALEGGSKAVGQIADTQIDANTKKDLARHMADIDIAKQEAIARTAESIRRAGSLWNATEGADAARKAKVADTTAVGAAETEVGVDREGKMGPAMAKTEGLLAKARADAERDATITRGNDKSYITAERNLAQAKHIESAGSAAQADLARWELGRKKAIAGLRDQAAALRAGGNDSGAEQTEQIISTMEGGTSKSYADVVKAAGLYESMAKDIEDPLKNGGKDGSAEAASYRAAAKQLLEGVSKKRGMPGDGEDKAKPQPKNSWNDATGEVTSNGVVIGKAKSAAEARALLARSSSGKVQ